MPHGKRRQSARRRRSHCREPHENALCRESWLRFLGSVTYRADDGSLRLNGVRPSDNARRAIYRWNKEGATPSVFTADRLLVALGLHLDDYFIYCASHGLTAWARGRAPAWHDEEEWLQARWSTARPRLRQKSG
jgi:hypothetical protein